MKWMSQVFNFIDLFCGAGGLSTGLKQAGLNEILSCDYNKDSVETMKLNHDHSEILHMDIRELTNNKLAKIIGKKKIHLVAGGPPCQGFSTIGKGDPNDDRNLLFKEFVRVVAFLKPELVLFENVTGILSKKNEKTFESIVRSFKKIGYQLDVKVMEAQKYGVAQTRRRTIIVGSLGKSFHFPEETHDVLLKNKYIRPKNLGDVLRQIKGPRVRDFNHDLTSATIKSSIDLKRLKYIPEGGSIRYQKDELKYLPKKLRLDVDWDTIREGRLRECHYRRLSRKLPSPTINTHNHHYYHPTELRKFTLREFALIQSFPLNYKFSGSRTSIIRQIGNAVPPLLAKKLGESILTSLRSKARPRKKREKTLNDFNDLRSGAFVY